MASVLCEVHPGSSDIVVSVGVRDVNDVPTYLWAPPDFVTRRQGRTYLPIGVVSRDKEKGVALIEFPHQADSGASRIWVHLSSLLEANEDGTSATISCQYTRKEKAMAMIPCEVRPGPGTVAVSVAVRDVNNVRTFLEIQSDFVTQRQGQTYLPIGVVYRDREKGVALIEFPVEADSGAHRIWVPLSSLLDGNGAPA